MKKRLIAFTLILVLALALLPLSVLADYVDIVDEITIQFPFDKSTSFKLTGFYNCAVGTYSSDLGYDEGYLNLFYSETSAISCNKEISALADQGFYELTETFEGKATSKIAANKVTKVEDLNYINVQYATNATKIIWIGNHGLVLHEIEDLYELEEDYGSMALKTFIAEPDKVTAQPSTHKLIIDGKEAAIKAYNIGGNNYFMLRSLALALRGTACEFEVTWDGAVNMISGKPYTEIGGELAPAEGEKSGELTKQKIFLDGQWVQTTAYNIGGNNYFQLKTIAAAFDFGLDWDGATSTVTIDTTKHYVPLN